MTTVNVAWPRLETGAWRETLDAMHLWTQILGKIRLACMPWINHSWHVPLYVSVRGLTTGPMPLGERFFEIELDLRFHRLEVSTDSGGRGSFPLEPMTVADFYEQLTSLLRAFDIQLPIHLWPVEIPDPIERLDRDERPRPFDAFAAESFWRALLQSSRVLTEFRARFQGKTSPVHFFWGAFDLALTRFSGRTAPPHPGGAPNCPDWVMREAYSHEVASCGFWPGGELGEAAFYAYAYPEPAGYATAAVAPAGAYYHGGLREFVLPYEGVRTAPDPDQALMAFLQSTYDAAANLGGWDRTALERPMAAAGVGRAPED